MGNSPGNISKWVIEEAFKPAFRERRPEKWCGKGNVALVGHLFM